MSVRWTHLTLPVADLDASVEFFRSHCGLGVVRDRKKEGGTTVWLGPVQAGEALPLFVLVLEQAAVRAPIDHLGFQYDSRAEVDAIAVLADRAGLRVDGPKDAGGVCGLLRARARAERASGRVHLRAAHHRAGRSALLMTSLVSNALCKRRVDRP